MHHFLSNDSTKFDIIAITETSQKKQNEEFFTDINLDGYTLYSTPTNTSKAGTINYTKINMTSLKGMISTYVTIFMNQFVLKSEIEVVKILFVVISTDTQMTIFRHQFLDYLESCLSKVSNENKEVYLCGDFNSDLLKLDKVNNYKRFYELMCRYGFLPQILQST